MQRFLLAFLPLLPAPALAFSHPEPAQPLTVLVEPRYERGEAVTVRVRNDGVETINVLDPSMCDEAFAIEDMAENRLQIVEPRPCVLMLPPPIEVRPGQTVTLGAWDQRIWSCPVDACTARQAPDGWYTAAVQYQVGRQEALHRAEAAFAIGMGDFLLTNVTDFAAHAPATHAEPLRVDVRGILPDNSVFERFDARIVPGPVIMCVRAPCPQPRTVEILPIARAVQPFVPSSGETYAATATVQLPSAGRYSLRIYGVRDGQVWVHQTEIVVEGEPVFGDVPGNHWAATYIRDLKERGVMTGNGGFIRPDWNITRAEVSKVALLASGRGPDVSLTNFWPDLKNTHTLKQHILTTLARGYLAPRPMACPANARCTGLAAPDAPATRHEALKTLMDAFEMPVTQPAAPAFPDAPSGEEAAYSSSAKNTGIVSGNDGRFLPDAPITRAEMAKIVANLLASR